MFQVSFTFEHLHQSIDESAYCTRTKGKKAIGIGWLANAKRRYKILPPNVFCCRFSPSLSARRSDRQSTAPDATYIDTSIPWFLSAGYIGPVYQTRGDRWKHPFSTHRRYNSARAGGRAGKTPSLWCPLTTAQYETRRESTVTVDSWDFIPPRSTSVFAHRTQTPHVFAGERVTPSPQKFLHELPVGGFVGGTIAAVEVHAVDLSRVVVS